MKLEEHKEQMLVEMTEAATKPELTEEESRQLYLTYKQSELQAINDKID